MSVKPKSPRAPSDHDLEPMSSMKHAHPKVFKPSMRGIGMRRGRPYNGPGWPTRYSRKQLRLMKERGITS